MEMIGFTFGLFGMTLAAITWERTEKLKKDFDALKEKLENS